MLSYPFVILVLFGIFLSCEKERSIPHNPLASWARSENWLLPKNSKNSSRIPTLLLSSPWQKGLKEINELDGIDLLPTQGQMPDHWEKVGSSFPDSVVALIEKHLYAVVFVKNLGSTGLTVILREEEKKMGLIFLDSDLLVGSSNEWASKKEKTAFQFNIEEDLQIQIAEKESFPMQNAIEWILLHELGHVIQVVYDHSPDFVLDKRDFRPYAFYKDVWWSESNSYFDVTFFPERPKIKFYGNPTLKVFPEGIHTYKKLENTPFVTLYAAINADDTYAEAFASYIHCILLKRPYKGKILQNGNSIFEFQNRIGEESGRRPKEFLENHFFQK